MTPSRRTVYGALVSHCLARLVTAPVTAFAFKTVEGKVRHWNDVPTGLKPYLGIALAGEQYQPIDAVHPVPNKWRLTPTGWLYVDTGADRGTAQNILADALDAIEAALAPGFADDDGKQTLSGTVYSALLKGVIETDEGALGALAVAHVHFELLVDAGAY